MKATFQNFLLPQLGVTHEKNQNLHQWMEFGRFSSLDFVDNRWNIRAYSGTELYGAFTPDFQRFSFSSFETFSLANLENTHCFATSWPLLKLYYSAFFAAHAMTRATGHGHINLNSRVLKSANEFLQVVDLDDNRISSGSYKTSIIENDEGVFLVLEPSSEGTGVHEKFWKYFCTYLDGLATEAIQQGLPSANSFLRETLALKSCIIDKGMDGVWFSGIRNAINYRHEYDCWLPNTKNSLPRKLDFSSELGDPDTMEATLNERENELSRIINLSTYLSSLNYQLILQVERDISGNSSFSKRWGRLKLTMAQR